MGDNIIYKNTVSKGILLLVWTGQVHWSHTTLFLIIYVTRISSQTCAIVTKENYRIVLTVHIMVARKSNTK